MSAQLNTVISTPKTPSQHNADRHTLVQFLKASADALRLDVLRALKTDSFGVLELCTVFSIKQSSMSHHLKVLANAGLVCTRREGNSIFYRRDNTATDNTLLALKEQLYATIDALNVADDIQTHIDAVHKNRAETAMQFFVQQGDKFKKQQDLIAPFEVYGPQVDAVIHSYSALTPHKAIEIGPGEGDFLPYLSQRFKHVVALDNASTMLNKAKATSATHALNNISFALNDTQYFHNQGHTFDCAVLNMVLHHTPSPNQLFSDIALGLKIGGALVICELCEHEQQWAKEACGDMWMGFHPNDLTRWANANALYEHQNSYFALRNGFQIQIRLFIKEP